MCSTELRFGNCNEESKLLFVYQVWLLTSNEGASFVHRQCNAFHHIGSMKCVSPVMISRVYLNLHPCHRHPMYSILIGRGWHNLPTQLFRSCIPEQDKCSSLITAAVCDDLWHSQLPLNYPHRSHLQYLSISLLVFMHQWKKSVTEQRIGQKMMPFQKSPAKLMTFKKQSRGSSSLASISQCFIANARPWHPCCLNYCYVNHLKCFGIGKAADLRCWCIR